MPILIISLIFLCLSNPFANAEGTWELIHSVSGSHWLDVFFLDESHGWAVGEYGAVMSTTDGGKEWNILHRVNQDVPRYYACYFISEKKGWVVGYNLEKGLLLSTEDGGKNLKEYGNFPGAYFCDVQFISEKEGWVVGGSGDGPVILHTDDGGDRWEAQEVGGSGHLKKVFFLDKNKGFAIGGERTFTPLFLRTDNGGKTWNKQPIPIGCWGYDIFFLNHLEGWIVLSQKLMKTTDGGNTWQEVPVPKDTHIDSVWFRNSNEGFFIGGTQIGSFSSGMVARTMDGCQTFEKLSGFSWLQSIFCYGGSFWVAGYDNIILCSRDGKNWDYQVEKAYNYSDIDFLTKDEGFLLGVSQFQASLNGGSVLLHTSDGGNSWNQEIDLSQEPREFECIDFLSESNGWIGGYAGIYNISNNGKNLRKIEGISGTFFDIKFSSNEDGWAIDINGNVWRTSDGGNSWREIKLDLDNGWLNEVEVFGRNVWIVGGGHDRGGVIFVTRNNGETFSKVRFDEDINGISFITEDKGWAVGYNGSIYATENGGKSWEKQKSGTTEYLIGVLFLSEKEGWAVGGNGTILHTINGGDSWEKQDTKTSEYINKVIYTGRDYLLAIGQWNTILKYTDSSLSQYSKSFDVSETNPQPITWGRIKNYLYQNYPNPFNPETWIPYQLAEDANVEIRIYSAGGQLVRMLNLGNKLAGSYTTRESAAYWDGNNEVGEQVRSGIYFYDMKVNDSVSIKKMVVLR
jgi:photosystem II stability/assembly factor-like uncharacterized protein